MTPSWRAVVQARLEEQWSPEQISAWLRQAHPDRPEWHLCHETIYQGLFFGGVDGLSRELTKNGLARQYLPRNSDLSIHTVDDDLRRIESLLNTRPGKRLGWRTPAEVFTTGLR